MPEIVRIPEIGPRPPEAPEAAGALERVPSERSKAERPAEPKAPLGALVQDDNVAAPPPPAGSGIDPRAVETILEEDLGDIYQGLTPETQERFRVVGEQASRQIAQLLMDVKLQVEKIIALIRQWLRLIPGVSKFFLEQATKIKMDKLMRLRPPSR